MKRTVINVISASLILIFFYCVPQEKTSTESPSLFYRPEVDLGILFHDVQMSRIFPDSKTFVDCDPIFSPEEILKEYLIVKKEADFNLQNFVEKNFILPESHSIPEYQYPDSIGTHIPAYWDQLVRQPVDVDGPTSLIPLPKPYVVPGGRFREIYYWDSYFTMQGLAASGRWDLIENMLDNFAYLIDTIGFIPNGNRTYFLSRSQPPFFGAMVSLWMRGKGELAGTRYLPQLEKEYDFWMDGAALLNDDFSQYRRVVRLPDGTILNRYFDDEPGPRPESYFEDVELGAAMDSTDRVNLYLNLRAACESGWDFSTRWFDDGQSLTSIVTTQIIPVDLNSLLLHLESTIAVVQDVAGNPDIANKYYTLAGLRATAIKKYLWDDKSGYYQDYYFERGTFTNRFTLAGMYPFYFDIADREQIAPALDLLNDRFLKDGGLATSEIISGQQWDSPNGWAPLQWISVIGLVKYEQEAAAIDISKRWIKVNQKVYTNTHKMMEKYNVLDLSLEAGGGEYPTQDGFGWTNGVVYALMQLTGTQQKEDE